MTNFSVESFTTFYFNFMALDKEDIAQGKSTDNKLAENNEKPFTRINFYMMGGCVALIILGFILMSGGGSDDPTAFNPDIFSTRRIVVGPALSFLGFLLMAFAIIYTPGKKHDRK